MGEYTALFLQYTVCSYSFSTVFCVNEFRYILCLNQSRWPGYGLVSWLQSSQTFHGLHLLGPSDRHQNRIACGTIQRGVCRLLVLHHRCHRPDWALGLYQLQIHLWKMGEGLQQSHLRERTQIKGNLRGSTLEVLTWIVRESRKNSK